jgi:hypothetical protein
MISLFQKLSYIIQGTRNKSFLHIYKNMGRKLGKGKSIEIKGRKSVIVEPRQDPRQ